MLRAKGLAVFWPYKGNAKRRAEVAKKNNVDAVLFVREDNAGRKLHISYLPELKQRFEDIDHRILKLLPERYTGISGAPELDKACQ